MENEKKFDLIITIVNNGFGNQAIEAAKLTGATGGTILNGRGLGINEAKKFLGICLQSEKEVVLILTKHSCKTGIMKAIGKEVGIKTPGEGMCFSLPVDDVEGVYV